ncbi:MAG: MBL fold metallo-hydrolase [Candidatus Thermoplasmatota archaeon]
MDLTVLGASSRYLAPLGAGTSYLLRHKDTRLLLDCGNGTHMRLSEELGQQKLSGVLVSHFHLDTVADLLPVAFTLPPGAPLVVPRGAMPRLGDLLRAYSMDRSWIDHARLLPVGRGDEHVIGGIKLSFAKAGHGCPGVVTRLVAEEDGTTLVYLGDTGARPWLMDFARGADLIVAHTLMLDRDEETAKETNLTAGAAGRLAREAGAGALALSHVPFYGNAEESLVEAQAAFGGKTVVLHEGETIRI